jgi:hypothetical protein
MLFSIDFSMGYVKRAYGRRLRVSVIFTDFLFHLTECLTFRNPWIRKIFYKVKKQSGQPTKSEADRENQKKRKFIGS